MNEENFSDEEITALGKAMLMNWSPSLIFILPDFSLSFALRDKIDISNNSNFGYNFALMYKNNYDVDNNKVKKKYTLLEEGSDDYLVDKANWNIDFSCFGDFEYELFDNLSFELTSLLIRLTDSETEKYAGSYTDAGGFIKNTEMSWTEQTLLNERIGGEFMFPALNSSLIEWQNAFTMVMQYEPFCHSNLYNCNTEDGIYEIWPKSEGAQILYGEVLDMIHDVTLKLSIPLLFLGNPSPDYLELGGNMQYRKRSTNNKRFIFGFQGTKAPLRIAAIRSGNHFSRTYWFQV